jgi:hypothetical protein
MATLDTLKILIEADSSGLETQLKKGLTTVSSFIDQMNSQQVDWENILAGALDTSIISGIASSFALAIEQTVNFQSSLLNLNNSAAGTASALNSSTGDITNSMVDLAGQTGAGLGQATAAYEALFKQVSNTGAASQLTGEIGEIAMETGTSLSTLMPQVITLFNQWGITTLPQAQSALQGLVESAATGKFSFQDLLSMISQEGPLLQGKTNVSDLAYQLEGLSNISTLSTSTISQLFSTIAQQGANPLSNFSLLTGVSDNTLSGANGLVTAFQKLSGFIQSSGSAAQTFGNLTGLATPVVAQLGATSAISYGQATVGIKQAQGAATDLQTYLDNHLTAQDKFMQAWSGFSALLAQKIGIPLLDTLTSDLEEITALWTTLDKGGFTAFLKELGGDTLAATEDTQTGPKPNLPSSSLINSGGTSTDKAIFGMISSFFASLSSSSNPSSVLAGVTANNPLSGSNAPSASATQASAPTTVNIYAGGAKSTAPVASQSTSSHAGTSLWNSVNGILAGIGI